MVAMRCLMIDASGDPAAEISWWATMAFIRVSYCCRRSKGGPAIAEPRCCIVQCIIGGQCRHGWIDRDTDQDVDGRRLPDILRQSDQQPVANLDGSLHSTQETPSAWR